MPFAQQVPGKTSFWEGCGWGRRGRGLWPGPEQGLGLLNKHGEAQDSQSQALGRPPPKPIWPPGPGPLQGMLVCGRDGHLLPASGAPAAALLGPALGEFLFFCPNSSIEMIHVPGSLPPEGSSPLVFSAFPKRVTAVPPPEDTLVTSRRDSVAVAASRLEPPPRGGTRPRSVSVDVPVLDISCYGTLRDVFRDWLLSLNTMTSRSLHFLRCGAGPCSVRPSPADRPSGGCRAHACAGWREDACFPLPWAHVGLGRAGSWGHMGALCVRPCGTDTPFPLLHPQRQRLRSPIPTGSPWTTGAPPSVRRGPHWGAAVSVGAGHTRALAWAAPLRGASIGHRPPAPPPGWSASARRLGEAGGPSAGPSFPNPAPRCACPGPESAPGPGTKHSA